MARKVNKVKVDLCSYPYYVIMGLRKVGKTTLFKDIVDLVYPNNPEKGLLISCGEENGYKALDGLYYEPATIWDMEEDENGDRGFVQICDDLIASRGTPDQVDFVAIDTFDELVEVATQQVYEEHRDDKLQYPKSLNDALGGYGAGHRRVNSLISKQLDRLNKAGMAVFIIAHTKVKELTDTLTQEPYELITNSLDSRFYGPIANKAQMIINIVVDRNIVGVSKELKKDKKNGEIEVVLPGRQTNLERYMYFRESPFVDAGGRFVGLPEKLPLSAENFMKAFEIGVKNSMKENISKKELTARAEEEKQKNVEDGQILFKKEQKNMKYDLALKIKAKLNEKPSDDIFAEVTKMVHEYGIKGFDEENLANVEISHLKSILKVLS